MKRIVLIILPSCFAIFLLIQFIRPEMTSSGEMTHGDIILHLQVPREVVDIMKGSCYDCHSENTVWPWYSRIAPASWLMARDVKGGRERLNLSHWNEFTVTEQIMMLQLMCREVETGAMPLKQYLLMHPDAKLSTDESAAFCDWARNRAAALQSGTMN